MNTLDELKNTGLKATLPRLKILEVFQNASLRHLAADDVYRLLLDGKADIGLATVYRVLMQFELDHGQHHDHLVCLDCGRVEEFFDEDIEKRQHDIAKAKGFVLQEHALSLYASCAKDNCPHSKQLA
jgi:Fur family ferric uptake transcriptional regulator